ncbi:MAG TPA: VWA domain-containing protein [Candidatus Binataceae bacterium]|jgi:Mg-chelatase subunit ChlD|nr:VWA domain-containing protein [Candidatus Binataceae bacterium]
MFERPLLLWLLALTPLAAAPGILAIRSGRPLAGAVSAVLRIGVCAALILMLAGARLPFRAAAHRMTVLVVMDQSQSIAPDQRQWMLRRLAAIRRALDPRDRLAVIGFGRDAQLLAPPRDPRLLALAPATTNTGATDIAGALTTAAGVFPRGDEKRLVLLSDGVETADRALDELPALSEAGIRVFTAAPPPSAVARIALTAFDAPATVHAQTSFALHLDVASEANHPVDARLRLYGEGVPIGGQQVRLRPGLNRFELPYQIDRPGAYMLKAAIEAAPDLALANANAVAAVSVAPPPHILLIANSPPESLVNALALRHYDVANAGPHGLSPRAADYLGYQAVIIANVTASALAPEVQSALNRYVADYGGGLIVTGDTLRDSKFHGGALEKTLPVEFEPQPPPPSREPIAVYLLIDRSNSMSYNSRFPAVRDGERIHYAKEAAIALLNQLDDTDYAGVIAFDSEPYVIGHLRPLGEDRDELLNRVSRLAPGGGTDFKEALEIAQREILATGLPVREVILLTDGDTNRQYHDHDQLMIDYAHSSIPVSTIRIGPDLENLRLLQDFAHNSGGVFFRVEDIRKLPQLLVHLTHEAQNFKHHSRTRVDLTAPSSIFNGIRPAEIPPIDFFAETRTKDGAEVPLVIRSATRTSPLLSTWQYELGRSAVFAADPDSMSSLAWIRWDRYAEFWSQLVNWVARAGDSGPFSLRVANSADGALTIEADKADAAPVNNLFARITGPRHAIDIAMTQMGSMLYRGEAPPLPRGKYVVTLIFKAGDTERVLLRRDIAVTGSDASNAAELRLQPPNLSLLRRIAAQTGGQFDASVSRMLRPAGAAVTDYRSIDYLLAPLAIFMLLGDVFIRRRMLAE